MQELTLSIKIDAIVLSFHLGSDSLADLGNFSLTPGRRQMDRGSLDFHSDQRLQSALLVL